MYEPRFYRNWVQDRELVSYEVVVKETDLFIRTLTDLSKKIIPAVIKYRSLIEKYIECNPEFKSSLLPLKQDVKAPDMIRDMISCSAKAGVGPMAAVAGIIAEYTGKSINKHSEEIIIENGGDIYISSRKDRIVGIYAGELSPFTGKIGIRITPGKTPLTISTSSGVVGHSLSFGTADAVIVLSKSGALSDAVATAAGNLVKTEQDINTGIEFAGKIRGISGIVIIKNDKIGMSGDIEITRII